MNSAFRWVPRELLVVLLAVLVVPFLAPVLLWLAFGSADPGRPTIGEAWPGGGGAVEDWQPEGVTGSAQPAVGPVATQLYVALEARETAAAATEAAVRALATQEAGQ